MFNKAEEYFKRYRGISVPAACARLIEIDKGILPLRRRYGRMVTPTELLESGYLRRALASQTGPYRFFGGPPGHLMEIEGPLLLVLVDCLLYQEAVLEAHAVGF